MLKQTRHLGAVDYCVFEAGQTGYVSGVIKVTQWWTDKGFIRATLRAFSALDCGLEAYSRISEGCQSNAENELCKRSRR